MILQRGGNYGDPADSVRQMPSEDIRPIIFNLFHVVERINGAVLWANLHLMFWLSLVPFTTAWLSSSYEGLFE